MDKLILTRKDNTTLDLFQSGSVWIEKGTQKKTLMSEDTVTLTVVSDHELNIGIGCTVTIYGTRYKINEEPTVEKNSSNNFVYECVFEAPFYDLVDIMYLNCDELKTTFPGSFSLVADLRGFLEVLINNCNRALGVGVWVLGICPETETLEQSFSNENCLSVLQKLCGADVYKQEFDVAYLDGVYTLNIRQQGRLHTEMYQYGNANGLYSLKRLKTDTTGLCNRMFVQGGERNIPANYRNYSQRLLLPNNALSVLEDTASISAYGLKEAYKQYDDIYPMREGTVTGISESDVLLFIDDAMDFDLNAKNADGSTKYLIAGTSAKVHFNSGNLAGYEFDLVSYNHTTKVFVIKKFTDERGQAFPAAGAFAIAPGDKYALLDIVLPQSYIDNGEATLLTVATADFNKSKPGKASYELPVSEIFMQSLIADPKVDWFAPGDSIPVYDADLGINQSVRLQSFSRDVLNAYLFDSITLNDDVTITRIERLIQASKTVERVIAMNSLDDPAKARRNAKVIDELMNMIIDSEGYFTDRIRPLSIETGMLKVGTRAGNLTLTSSATANYNNDKSKCLIGSGTLTHLQIEDTIRSWTMPQLLVTGLVDANIYYLFAKCPRVGGTGAFVLDTATHKLDEDASFYWFPIGVLSSVIDGYREFPLTYGSAAIYGRSIKAGQVVNTAGEVFLDIDKREIYGKITFKASDGSYKDVAAVETAAADASAKVDNIKIGGVNLLRNSTTLGLSSWHSDNGTSIFITQKFNKDAIVIQPAVAGGSAYVLLNLALKEDEYYMFSVDVYGTTPCTLSVYDTNKYFGGVDGNLPERISIPFQYKAAKTPAITIAISNSAWSNVLQNFQIEEGNKATSHSLAPEDVEAAANAYADAKKTEATTIAAAYTDGKVTASEQAAIDAAKAYTDAKKIESEAYTDGKVTASEQAAINAANAYADAKKAEATTIAAAYADGKVTAEEQRAISDASAKSEAARQAAVEAAAADASAKVDNIKIGGRNLLRNTLINSSYAATSTPVERMRFTITQNLIIGQQYTFQIKAKVATANTLLFITLTSIEDSGVMWGFRQEVHVTPTNTEYCTYTFTTTISANLAAGKVLVLYQEGGCAACIVDYVQLEEGNKATGHTLAPEDVDATIATAQATADSKAKHFYGTANPTPPYVQGRDIWTNGTDLYECAVTRLTGSYVANDFVKATGYDNTQTVIDGGMVTSGTVQLAGDAATILAGITGQGTAATSVRIWSGASFANRATASFRVLQSGDVFSKGAYQVQNQNNETNAGFSGEGTAATSVRIWGGATYENRATAPFRVQQDGTAKMTAIEIKTNANTMGRRLELSSSNNNLAMFVDNVKVLDLISDYDTTDSVVVPAIKLNDANFLWSNIMYANKTVLSRGGIFCKLDYKGITLSSDSGTNGTTLISRSSISTGFITASNQVQFTGISSAYPSESGVVYRDSNGFLKIR